jgi:ABC-2 type transport system permease protein
VCEVELNKIKTIIRKEWAEIFKNRMVIFTVVFLPVLMTAIPLAVLYSMQGGLSATSNRLPAQMSTAICPEGLNGGECIQLLLVNQFMMLFMIVPVIIPATIAAYSIVGEKTTRSLEPLLATPITTVELLVGKCLAAVIPAILATYGAYLLFAAGSWFIVANKTLLTALLDARWLMAIFIVGPLLAVLAVTFGMMVSSRVNDPRAAEQISMIIIVPVIGSFVGQLAGLFVLDMRVITVVAIVMLALDSLMVYLATRVFQRESILTRWR